MRFGDCGSNVRVFHRKVAVRIRVGKGDVHMGKPFKLDVVDPAKSVVGEVPDHFDGLSEGGLQGEKE